jgi:U3 small nucleolar RNA-associated protein 10
VPQLAVLPTLPAAGRADLLPECIAHLANTMDREDQLKKLNLDVLMTTRSEDPRVRLLALRSAVEAWTIAGRQFARKYISI